MKERGVHIFAKSKKHAPACFYISPSPLRNDKTALYLAKFAQI